jgi:hypothetical protein
MHIRDNWQIDFIQILLYKYYCDFILIPMATKGDTPWLTRMTQVAQSFQKHRSMMPVDSSSARQVGLLS